jgi:hypothetical protein
MVDDLPFRLGDDDGAVDGVADLVGGSHRQPLAVPGGGGVWSGLAGTARIRWVILNLSYS